MAFYQFQKTQVIPALIDEVWEFISSPANLKKITPEYMGFDIQSKDLPAKMYPGMIISYRIQLFPGFRTTWVTEITHIREKEYFVDEQRIGPYSIWHHQHFLIPVENGVLMKDIVSYKPPMHFLGRIANALFIRKKLEVIFNYREKVLNEIFSGI